MSVLGLFSLILKHWIVRILKFTCISSAQRATKTTSAIWLSTKFWFIPFHKFHMHQVFLAHSAYGMWMNFFSDLPDPCTICIHFTLQRIRKVNIIPQCSIWKWCCMNTMLQIQVLWFKHLFKWQAYTKMLLSLTLSQTNFPWEFEIAGFNCTNLYFNVCRAWNSSYTDTRSHFFAIRIRQGWCVIPKGDAWRWIPVIIWNIDLCIRFAIVKV